MQGEDRGSAATVLASPSSGMAPIRLPRVVDRPRLADDGDLDLAGVPAAAWRKGSARCGGSILLMAWSGERERGLSPRFRRLPLIQRTDA